MKEKQNDHPQESNSSKWVNMDLHFFPLTFPRPLQNLSKIKVISSDYAVSSSKVIISQ